MKFIKNAGVSLIELVVFIVIIGIIAGGLLIGMNRILVDASTPGDQLTASQLAKARMEIILQRRLEYGFASVIDPCVSTPTLSACQSLTGYSVTSSITSEDSNHTLIEVSVSGRAQAKLFLRIANYA